MGQLLAVDVNRLAVTIADTDHCRPFLQIEEDSVEAQEHPRDRGDKPAERTVFERMEIDPRIDSKPLFRAAELNFRVWVSTKD